MSGDSFSYFVAFLALLSLEAGVINYLGAALFLIFRRGSFDFGISISIGVLLLTYVPWVFGLAAFSWLTDFTGTSNLGFSCFLGATTYFY